MTEPLFVVRHGVAGDRDFVLASWVESNRHSVAAKDAGEVYREEHRKVARCILERVGERPWVGVARLDVAHAPGDTDAILGWSLTGDESRVYYVYVKRDARRLGIARRLLAPHIGERAVYTHRPAIRGLKIPDGWTYNPYLNWRL